MLLGAISKRIYNKKYECLEIKLNWKYVFYRNIRYIFLYNMKVDLKFKLVRISQTEEKLKKDKIHNCSKAISTHYEVGAKVRKAIEDIGGTMPEDLLTPEKSIKQVEREQLKRLKDNKTKLILDE